LKLLSFYGTVCVPIVQTLHRVCCSADSVTRTVTDATYDIESVTDDVKMLVYTLFAIRERCVISVVRTGRFDHHNQCLVKIK